MLDESGFSSLFLAQAAEFDTIYENLR